MSKGEEMSNFRLHLPRLVLAEGPGGAGHCVGQVGDTGARDGRQGGRRGSGLRTVVLYSTGRVRIFCTYSTSSVDTVEYSAVQYNAVVQYITI